MSKICDLCNKGVTIGRDGIHKHSGQWRARAPKVRRGWSPNLRTVRVVVGGTSKKLRLCAKCLKSKRVRVVEES